VNATVTGPTGPGSLDLYAVFNLMRSGTVHLVLDVVGYFE
jgi:hypothetical protein